MSLNPFSVIEICPEESDLCEALGLEPDRAQELKRFANEAYVCWKHSASTTVSKMLEAITHQCDNANETAYVVYYISYCMGFQDAGGESDIMKLP